MSDSSDLSDQVPPEWSSVTPPPDLVLNAWTSDSLSMTVSIYEEDAGLYPLLVDQDIVADGFATSATSHFTMCPTLVSAVDEAVDFMIEASAGEHKIECLTAIESEEMVDFVCVYHDDIPGDVNSEILRENLQMNLGQVQSPMEPAPEDEDSMPVVEDAEAVTIDVFPQLKTDIDVLPTDEDDVEADAGDEDEETPEEEA